MSAATGKAARREFGVVVAVALSGIALTMLVAFAPWYESPMSVQQGGGSVVPVSTLPDLGITTVSHR
jgi:hypothetical protein